MSSVFFIPFRVFRKMKRVMVGLFDKVVTLIILSGNKIKLGKNVRFNGAPFIDVNRTGQCVIGDNSSFNSRIFYNPIGRNQRCQIVVGEKATLAIGKNVGISSTAIICYKSITVGNNVKIGGNTVIYDSDFHSLDYLNRRTGKADNPEMKAVTIDDDVFIGAHVTILKGVHIGPRAIVAAGSVITKDIPADETWGGNPAQKIR